MDRDIKKAIGFFVVAIALICVLSATNVFDNIMTIIHKDEIILYTNLQIERNLHEIESDRARNYGEISISRSFSSEGTVTTKGATLDVSDGYHEVNYQNGDRYDGKFRGGKIDGFGTYYFANEDKFEGKHVDGIKHGQGLYYWSSGDWYEGDFPINYGTYHWSNGDWYTGNFPGEGTLFHNGVERPSTAVMTDTGWNFRTK